MRELSCLALGRIARLLYTCSVSHGSPMDTAFCGRGRLHRTDSWQLSSDSTPRARTTISSGRDTWAAHLHVHCIHKLFSVHCIFLVLHDGGGQEGGICLWQRCSETELLSGELRPQASQGNEHQGLHPYMPQIASVRNWERDGGWQCWDSSKVSP